MKPKRYHNARARIYLRRPLADGRSILEERILAGDGVHLNVEGIGMLLVSQVERIERLPARRLREVTS